MYIIIHHMSISHVCIFHILLLYSNTPFSQFSSQGSVLTIARPEPKVAARFGPRSAGESSAIRIRQSNFSFKSWMNVSSFKWFLITTTRINSRRYTRTSANPNIKSLNFEYCVFQSNMSVELLVMLKNGVKSCFRHWSLSILSLLRASCRRSLTLRLCWGSVQGYHMAMEASGHTSWSLVTDSVREIKPFRLCLSQLEAEKRADGIKVPGKVLVVRFIGWIYKHKSRTT